ncbi:MAG: hypothetical protein SV775_00880 [Thermodesulfobacteriota bacterium]|nr:hypothetical protein [Thermodesulfobacteriota bacterium]
MDTRLITAILLRCLIYSFALLLSWFVIFLIAGDWIYGFHSRIFDITRQDFDLMHYCGMAFLKILVFVTFVIPYFAIRSAGKRRNLPE